MNKIPQDPIMCMSFVNTKLRDQYSDLDALCEEYEVERTALEEKLLAAGYRYDEGQNQFR